jgi:putative membrane protein
MDTKMKTMKERDNKVPEHSRASEFLANERTFLAWVRTSVTILSFGFVVAKFSVWLRELAGQTEAQPPQSLQNIYGSWMGVALMVLGSILSVLAAWRYQTVNRNIDRDQVKPNLSLVTLITLVVVLMAVAMIAFVFVTINHRLTVSSLIPKPTLLVVDDNEQVRALDISHSVFFGS